MVANVIDGVELWRQCECTKKAILDSKLKFANIPDRYKDVKVSDFKTSIYKLDAEAEKARSARNIVKNYILKFKEFEEMGKGLYFFSDTKGSGKTMLSIALGNALMNVHMCSVKYTTTLDLLQEIKNTYSDMVNVTETSILNDLCAVRVLILDDIGIDKATGWANEIFYKILDTRLSKKLVTIFTSNMHISQLKHDSRIISRIEKMAIPVIMPEESIRSAMAKSENEALLKMLSGGGE